MGRNSVHAGLSLNSDEVDAATTGELMVEIDRLSSMLCRCVRRLAAINPKPVLIESLSPADEELDGIAQLKAREVADRVLVSGECA
jgi:hypothetical protein